MKGLLIVVSGPSGTGKGTVCDALLKETKNLSYSISATTRQPRKGEIDGKNYYFLTKDTFEEKIRENAFLEYANVYGNYYGTPLGHIEDRREMGEDILLEIDTQGALNVMKRCPDGVFIFLIPPSLQELERRIRGRGTESQESLKERLSSAEQEIRIGKKYQYVVVNDDISNAVHQIQAILLAEHCRNEKEYKIEEVLKK